MTKPENKAAGVSERVGPLNKLLSHVCLSQSIERYKFDGCRDAEKKPIASPIAFISMWSHQEKNFIKLRLC